MNDPCPSDARLRQAIAGEEADDAAFLGHVESCQDCRRRLDQAAWGSEWSAHSAELELAGPLPPGVWQAVAGDAPGGAGASAAPLDAPAADVLQRLAPPALSGAARRLGRYEVHSLIGRGGMGVVLAARDPALGCDVAIKVLSPHLAVLESARHRFAREARAAAAIRHPGVVCVHNVGEESGLHYLVMDLVRGESLEERLQREGPMAVEVIRSFGAQIAHGLAAAHACGVLHRDIKPANILLEAGSERVKIADFGVARCADEPAMTGAGERLGTPQYMSPEQCLGHEVDARTDLFSLGGVLYAMAAGGPPFAGESSVAVIRSVCDAQPRRLAEVRPDMPRRLAALIDRLLEKDPARRPGSACDVAALLEAGEADAAPALRPPTGRRARLLSWTAAAVAALFGVLALARWPREPAGGGATGGGGAPEGVASAAAFVVLGDGVALSRWATLDEAVAAAPFAGTIEITADGPFRVAPMVLRGKPLAIRAAPGRRPAIIVSAGHGSLVDTDAPLVLEGLELGQEAPGDDFSQTPAPGGQPAALILVTGATLHAANLRLVCQHASRPLVGLQRARDCVLVNCELYGRSAAVFIEGRGAGAGTETPPPSLRIENCLHAGGVALSLDRGDHDGSTVTLRQSTWRGLWLVQGLNAVSTASPVRIEAERNLFLVDSVIKLSRAPARGVGWLRDVLQWQDRDNVYDCDTFIGAAAPGRAVVTAQMRRLDEWKRLWGSNDPGTIAGKVRLQGSAPGGLLDAYEPAAFAVLDVRRRAGAALESEAAAPATPGADVTVVGPGAAYARWMDSPRAAAWHRETGAALAAAPR